MYFNTLFTLSGEDADEIPGHLSSDVEVRFAMGIGRNRFSHVKIMARIYEPRPSFVNSDDIQITTYITPDGRIFSYLLQPGKRANRPKVGKLVYVEQLKPQQLAEYEANIRQPTGPEPLGVESEFDDGPISLSDLLQREPEFEFDE